MNIFLLGNGYDLHHTFPTRYIDFLNVVGFIIEKEGTTFSTIGEVFSNPQLQEKNKFIKDAYEKHSRIYDGIVLDKEQLCQMLELAKKNSWFKYFDETCNRELGWIDFEKEIAFVISSFEMLFQESRDAFLYEDGLKFDVKRHPVNGRANFVIRKFDFFMREKSCLLKFLWT